MTSSTTTSVKKRITAIASAFALAGTMAVATPAASAQPADPVEVQQPGDGSSIGGEGEEGETSSFDDFKEELSSEAYKEENGTSSDTQKWVLGVGITAAILALGAAIFPQLQQFLP